jgi:arginyl-tRNA--protein-N-Asp/Glu arginylyltransferase
MTDKELTADEIAAMLKNAGYTEDCDCCMCATFRTLAAELEQAQAENLALSNLRTVYSNEERAQIYLNAKRLYENQLDVCESSAKTILDALRPEGDE